MLALSDPAQVVEDIKDRVDMQELRPSPLQLGVGVVLEAVAAGAAARCLSPQRDSFAAGDGVFGK
jgi:hypothetical protein